MSPDGYRALVVNVLKHMSSAMVEIFFDGAFKSMSDLVTSRQTFGHNPHALYVADATVQECTKRGGLYDATKPMFSGKHKAYYLKTEVEVQPSGQAIYVTPHWLGSVHDMTIFRSQQSRHVQLMTKSANKIENIPDLGPMNQKYPNQWSILLDKGYDGASSLVRTITPKKYARAYNG